MPSLRSLLIALSVLAAPLAGAATARADETTGCPGRVIEQPFTQFDDAADYFLVPDGDFSAGAAGWGLAGAEVVEDNEPWYVHGGTTAAAVRLRSGESATTPGICVGQDDPTMRFFAEAQGSPAGTLDVEVLYEDVDGTPRALTIGSLDAADLPEWAPAPALPITANDREMTVAFRFTAHGPGSAWVIDDVYVDPYRKG